MNTPVENSASVGKTSALAKWSLALAVSGIVPLGFLGSIPALICGYMAIPRIKRSSGALTGRGLAIAGLVVAYVGIVIQIVVLSVLLSAARDRARQTACVNNLKQIGIVARMYSLDNQEHFPTNFSGISKYIGDCPQVFVCPATGHKAGQMSNVDQWSDYVLVPNRLESDPPDAVLAFSKPGCYPGKGGTVLFVAGHVLWCPLDEYTRLTAKLSATTTER